MIPAHCASRGTYRVTKHSRHRHLAPGVAMAAIVALVSILSFQVVSSSDSGERLVPSSIQLSANYFDGTNGVIIYGIDEGDRAVSVSSKGDWNGDGISDLVIGASTSQGSSNSADTTGEVYVLFGKPSDQHFSSPIHLSASYFDGTNGVIIYGIDGGDRAGYSVSLGGDMNGDRVDDLVISAFDSYGSSNSAQWTGEVYVLFGKPAGQHFSSPIHLSASYFDGTNGIIIYGIEGGDRAGSSVVLDGDLTGDGISDLVISATESYGSLNSAENTGEVYVLFGKPSGQSFASTIQLSASYFDGTNGVIIYGIGEGDRPGWFMSSGGDWNGDGVSDLAIGSGYGDGRSTSNPDIFRNSGEVYVLFGKPAGQQFSSPIYLSHFDGTNGVIIYGIDQGDVMEKVSLCGDINGDQVADLVIGAAWADGSSNSAFATGEVYVLFGKPSGQPFTSPIHLSASYFDGTNGVIIYGIDVGDLAGSLSSGGDWNGDGINDLVIGAPSINSRTGEVYVLFGKPSAQPFTSTIHLSTSYFDGTNGLIIYGIDEGDLAGNSVSLAGDINGDGGADLIIPASGAGSSNSAQRTGEVYVLFGFPKPTTVTTSSETYRTSPSPASTQQESNNIVAIHQTTPSLAPTTPGPTPTQPKSGNVLVVAIAAGVSGVGCLIAAVSLALWCKRRQTKAQDVAPPASTVPGAPVELKKESALGSIVQEVIPPILSDCAETGSHPATHDTDDDPQRLASVLTGTILQDELQPRTGLVHLGAAACRGLLEAGSADPVVGLVFRALKCFQDAVLVYWSTHQECARLAVWAGAIWGVIRELTKEKACIDEKCRELLKGIATELDSLATEIVQFRNRCGSIPGKILSLFTASDFAEKLEEIRSRITNLVELLQMKVHIDTRHEVQKILDKTDALPRMSQNISEVLDIAKGLKKGSNDINHKLDILVERQSSSNGLDKSTGGVLQNEEARKFWEFNFGSKSAIESSIFLRALKNHPYAQSLKSSQVESIMHVLDCNKDQVIEMVEFNIFTQKDGLENALRQVVELQVSFDFKHIQQEAARQVPNGRQYHAFLAHDWGLDEKSRDNHFRVSQVHKYLIRKGLSIWFDEERMSGGHLIEQLREGILSSSTFVCFITQRYNQKLDSKGHDYCKNEFQFACRKDVPLIPAVMEERMLDHHNWKVMANMSRLPDAGFLRADFQSRGL